jgi:hypothetical protein
VKTQAWLPHALMRFAGPVRSASGKHSKSSARVWATRAILIAVVIIGGVGAAKAELSSHHGATGHTHSAIHARPAVPFMY